ncbi:unnamed protein product, partial [Didymodactylos carnosus]
MSSSSFIFQPLKDFNCLFKSNKFSTIDGLRTSAHLSLVYLHIVMVFVLLIPMYPNKEWLEYLKTNSFLVTSYAPLILEIFFLLTGFLLTYQTLTIKENINIYLFIFKRFLRYLPGLGLIYLYIFIFDDSSMNKNWIQYFIHLPLIQNYINTDYWSLSLIATWSNSLDFQVYILLSILIYFLSIKYKLNLRQIYDILYILLLSSFCVCFYCFDSRTMNTKKEGVQLHPLIALNYTQVKIYFEFNNLPSLSINETTVTNDLNYLQSSIILKNHLKYYYYPLHIRYSSFIVGSLLAVKLLLSGHNIQNNNTFSRFKKLIYGILMCCLFLSIIRQLKITQLKPSEIMITIVMCSIRQLISIIFAFLLYTTLVDKQHSYHNKYLKQILCFHIFTPLAKLSYSVYLLHFRIASDLVYKGPL